MRPQKNWTAAVRGTGVATLTPWLLLLLLDSRMIHGVDSFRLMSQYHPSTTVYVRTPTHQASSLSSSSWSSWSSSSSSSQLHLSSVPQEPSPVLPSSSLSSPSSQRRRRSTSRSSTASGVGVVAVAATNNQAGTSTLPEWAQRPLRRRSTRNAASATLDQAELVIGRIAMLGALILLVQEVCTGESILEQCGDALGTVAAQWHY